MSIVMKNPLFLLTTLLFTGFLLTSCDDDETYAEQVEKERKVISSFLSRDVTIYTTDGEEWIHVGKITTISESQFYAQDSTTNVDLNEYVVFDDTGIYMQIVRVGAGEKMVSGDTKRLICRYVEYNILGDSVQTSNSSAYWQTNPDILDVSLSYGTFTGSFNTSVNGGGAMYQYYGSTTVPTGWLVPLAFIRVGRQTSEDEEIAKVRLIVPHAQGHSEAMTSVYPCFYEITYQETRN